VRTTDALTIGVVLAMTTWAASPKTSERLGRGSEGSSLQASALEGVLNGSRSLHAGGLLGLPSSAATSRNGAATITTLIGRRNPQSRPP
jgi:hypothetical protein